MGSLGLTSTGCLGILDLTDKSNLGNVIRKIAYCNHGILIYLSLPVFTKYQ